MKTTFKLASIVAATAAFATGTAHADLAETKGGIKVKTDDGRFEMSIGGRIHYDAFLFDEDTDAAYGSVGLTNRGGLQFRREYLTLTGKLYGWEYKYEHDFAAEGGSATCTTVDQGPIPINPGPDGLPGTADDFADPSAFTPSCTLSNTGASGNKEMWIAKDLGPGKLTLGQFKPYRGMEELTSSNEITFAERPVTSASGIYNGRQYLMGVGYKGIIADQLGWGIDAMQLASSNNTTEGRTFGGRTYWFPMAGDGQVVHVALSYHLDSEDVGSSSATPGFTYGGRRGQSITFGNAGASASCGQSTPAGCGEQQTFGVELAGAFGPITLQGEYARAKLEDSYLDAGGDFEDSDVDAWYVQASWFLTGEKKPYKKDRGAFGSPKPLKPYGAWEAAVRYESIENKDEDETNTICAVSGLSGAAAADKCEVEQITIGVNWYVNPNVRFLLNYYLPTTDLGGTAGKDEPEAATLRTQLSF